MTLALLCALVFVNGATDAVASVSSAVSCGALGMRTAVRLSALFNFIGMTASALLFPQIAGAVASSAGIEGDAALCAVMLTVVLWAGAAWYFGIPTSESHAVAAAIWGCALFTGGIYAVDFAAAARLILWLVLSCSIGWCGAYALRTVMCGRSGRHDVLLIRISCAVMSFWHGAQDGQKFIGLYMLAHCTNAPPPLAVIAVGAAIMAAGTRVGGGRIVDKISRELGVMNTRESLICDISASLSLCAASVAGAPVSTTHVRTCAAAGAQRSPDRGILRELAIAWALTFPACTAIAYAITFIISLFGGI